MTFSSYIFTFASLATCFGTLSAQTLGPNTDLQLHDGTVNPDGFARQGILVQNLFPSPAILANKGDNFKINVVDELTNSSLAQSTSIHWHGLFQHGTAWADGPAFVTQCPIAPGNSFLYDFDVPDQAGTYWYHSHLRTQYCDGLRGPLVIYDQQDPFANLYDVDDASTIITLADWYHVPTETIVGGAIADSTLINGLGRYAGGPASNLSVITVEQGKRYRFRLISISCDPSYTFSIDNHTMTVIEVDGVNHQPLPVDSIPIFAAQRYSFILEANKPVGNYWIRALPDAGQSKLQGYNGGINSAILRYVGASKNEPADIQPPTSVNPLVETNLHPLVNAAAPGLPFPGGADKVLNLDLGFNASTGLFTINGTSFIPPTVPVLLQILSGAKAAQEILPAGNVYALPKDSTIEIVFSPGNAPGGPHPFHLHGHTFSVVRSAGNASYNFENPVQRDVVSTGSPDDRVTIRFETNNPGPWFLHCHIDFHLNAGFAVVMAEDIPDIASVNPVPEAWDQLCPIYDALPASEQ
uniref:laccase n=1 Tax=Crustodontia chrysocreas TaxID=2716695 RepID=A0A0N9H8A2_9APHY|nr:laccase [Crustodontia chrysocreas]